MANNKLHLSMMIDAKDKIRNAIFDNKDCVALMLNKRNISSDDEAYDEALSHILDHRYVDDIVVETGVWVGVEVELDASSPEMLDQVVYIEVTCSQNYMQLNNWPGRRGNRRDNVLCCIDKVINGASNFGIGKLSLESVRVTSAPKGFSSILATYVVPNFSHKRGVGNYD